MKERLKRTLSGVAPYRQGESAIAGLNRVVKLSANELPHPPSPAAIAAFHETGETLNRYPDGAQTALRAALAAEHGIPEECVFAGNGSEEAIGLIVRAMLSEGDEIIFSENSFLMTEIYARSVGARIVRCPESDYRVDIDRMLAAVTRRTRIVYVCSPNNPTGTYTPIDELRRLSEELHDDALLLVDAAYAEFADASDYDAGQSLFSPEGCVAVARTFSKAYGLAGLRIGWALAPDKVLDAVTRLRSPFNANAAAMNAAAAAVRDQQYLRQSVARIRATRDQFSNALRSLGIQVVPSQANFVLLVFPDGGDEARSLEAALRSAGILGRPVADGVNAFRITIGAEEEMADALAAIRSWAAHCAGPE